jgi:Flp pilus assembly pilin Flp
MRRVVADERGQTQTEYLMVAGLMAAVVVVVFVTMYWPQVNSALREAVWKIWYSIGGQLDDAAKEVGVR